MQNCARTQVWVGFRSYLKTHVPSLFLHFPVNYPLSHYIVKKKKKKIVHLQHGKSIFYVLTSVRWTAANGTNTIQTLENGQAIPGVPVQLNPHKLYFTLRHVWPEATGTSTHTPPFHFCWQWCSVTETLNGRGAEDAMLEPKSCLHINIIDEHFALTSLLCHLELKGLMCFPREIFKRWNLNKIRFCISQKNWEYHRDSGLGTVSF